MTEQLTHRRNFLLLWSGQSISQLGGQLSIFALPTIAILVLHAKASQVAALQSLEFSVVALLAIFVGVVVDRFKRRPLMMAANVVRILSIGSLPFAFFFHRLSLGQFFVVAAITAAANVIFDTAYGAFAPVLIGRKDFGKANAKMTMTASAAEAIGNSSSGAIVQFVGAPLALVLNCVTYVISCFSLARLNVEERVCPTASNDRAVRQFMNEFCEGARLVWNNKALRSIGLTSATAYYSGSMVTTVFAIYAYRVLHLSPVTFGLLMGFANVGLFGGAVAKPLAARLGPRTTLACATALSGIAKLTFLITPVPIVSLVVGRVLLSLTGPIFNIVDQEVRVLTVSDSMMGRMNATMRTIIWGALPLGSLTGGFLADAAGIQVTMLLGGLIGVLSAAWMTVCPAIPQYERVGTRKAWRINNRRRRLATIPSSTASFVLRKTSRFSTSLRAPFSRRSNGRSTARVR
ncbi:MAG: MFS transporter [Candidatus Eremiobacteraeota bacterium]|nr:MFS transporter [Candidatus Eremiobacteraeota bacterium]